MGPRKYPEAEDRGEAVIRNPDDEPVDADPERRRIDDVANDTNANQPPRKPNDEGGGARNESIEG